MKLGYSGISGLVLVVVALIFLVAWIDAASLRGSRQNMLEKKDSQNDNVNFPDLTVKPQLDKNDGDSRPKPHLSSSVFEQTQSEERHDEDRKNTIEELDLFEAGGSLDSGKVSDTKNVVKNSQLKTQTDSMSVVREDLDGEVYIDEEHQEQANFQVLRQRRIKSKSNKSKSSKSSGGYYGGYYGGNDGGHYCENREDIFRRLKSKSSKASGGYYYSKGYNKGYNKGKGCYSKGYYSKGKGYYNKGKGIFGKGKGSNPAPTFVPEREAPTSPPTVSSATVSPTATASPSTSQYPSAAPSTSSSPTATPVPSGTSTPTILSSLIVETTSPTATVSPTATTSPSTSRTPSTVPSTSSSPTITLIPTGALSSTPSIPAPLIRAPSLIPQSSLIPTSSWIPTSTSSLVILPTPTASQVPTSSLVPTSTSAPTPSSSSTESAAPSTSSLPTQSVAPSPSLSFTGSPTLTAAPTITSSPSTTTSSFPSGKPTTTSSPTSTRSDVPTKTLTSVEPTTMSSPTSTPSDVPTTTSSPTATPKVTPTDEAFLLAGTAEFCATEEDCATGKDLMTCQTEIKCFDPVNGAEVTGVCLNQGNPRFSLFWQGFENYDLHLILPSGIEVNSTNPFDKASGTRLVLVATPDGKEVGSYSENIIMPLDRTAPAGDYTVFIKLANGTAVGSGDEQYSIYVSFRDQGEAIVFAGDGVLDLETGEGRRTTLTFPLSV